MEVVISITLLVSSYEFFYTYHGFKATVLEVQGDICSRVGTDPDKILQF